MSRLGEEQLTQPVRLPCLSVEETDTVPDVAEPGGLRQSVAADNTQRVLPCVAAQICDGVRAEIYDGLTPVTMTL